MDAASEATQFVFGYGSLLAHIQSGSRQPTTPVRIDGFRRSWNVAMDNAVDLPGYKYYLEPGGERPPLFVTFLNLVHAAEQTVNGMLLEVSSDDLHGLDARERNYTRIEVTDRVLDAPDGTVWTYIGTGDARDRYERGAATGRTAISRAYLAEVLQGFASLGVEALVEYATSTDPPRCPIVDLDRVDHDG